MKSSSESLRKSSLGGVFLPAAILTCSAALSQATGPGPVCEFQFDSDARAPGRISASFTRSTGTTTCSINVDGTAGGNPTTRAEMAGGMCTIPAACWRGGSLSCINPSAVRVCVQSTGGASVTTWSITCKSTTAVPMGVVISNVGTGDACLPLQHPDAIPPQKLVLVRPPRIEIRGSPRAGDSAVVRFQAEGGPQVQIPIRDRISLTALAAMVTAELTRAGYLVENEGLEPSPADGENSAFIRIIRNPNGSQPQGVTSYIYDRGGQNELAEDQSFLTYGVELEGSTIKLPALSPWGMVGGGLLVLAIGCLLLRRSRPATRAA